MLLICSNLQLLALSPHLQRGDTRVATRAHRLERSRQERSEIPHVSVDVVHDVAYQRAGRDLLVGVDAHWKLGQVLRPNSLPGRRVVRGLALLEPADGAAMFLRVLLAT